MPNFPPAGMVGGPLPSTSPSATFNRALVIPPSPYCGKLIAPWTVTNAQNPNAPALLGANTTTAQWIDIGDAVHDLATVLSVTCWMVAATHVSLPNPQPSMYIARSSVLGSGAITYLSSSPQQFAGFGTVGAYNNGGSPVSFTYNCNQNQVVDRSNYRYLIALIDENTGGGVLAGNQYFGFQIVYRMNASAGDFTSVWWA